MKFYAKKNFSVKYSGRVTSFSSGDVVNLPEDRLKPLLLAGVLTPTDAEGMEAEYFTLLARFWEIDEEPAAGAGEARRLVVRLNELYKELHRLGRRVPVRLPLERNRGEVQTEMAL